MQDGRLTSLRLTERFRERASSGSRGPLHGIPIFLKDNIATADRLHTSAGSLALKDCLAPRDAFLVTKLREAGAVILGKANMTEWANFLTTNMPAATARAVAR